MDSDLAQRVTGLLRSLGDSAEEIAGALAAANIRGTIGDAYACPISHYLGAQLAGLGLLAVGVHYDVIDVVRDRGLPHEQLFVRIDTPAPCLSFLERFDNRFWPQLVSRGLEGNL